MKEEIKKRLKGLLMKYGVPAAVIIFLGLIVLGMIIGPSIQIGGPSSGSVSQLLENIEWERFLKYFYSVQYCTEKRTRTITEDEETFEQTEYKIETKLGERIVGHNLNLSEYTDIDEELKELYKDSGGTADSSWIIDYDAEAYVEGILIDIEEALIEAETAHGIRLTKYQRYALVSFFYDNGGVDAVKNDTTGILSKFKETYGTETIGKYGQSQDLPAVDSRDNFILEFLKFILDFNPEKVTKDAILFYTGYYSGLDVYALP